MTKDKDIPAEEFLALKIAEANLEELNKKAWIVNQKELSELVIDYDLSSKQIGYSLKTLADVGGHIKIIEERSYRGVDAGPRYMWFLRIKSEKFIQGQEGYEQRAKMMLDAGYDINKLGGGRER